MLLILLVKELCIKKWNRNRLYFWRGVYYTPVFLLCLMMNKFRKQRNNCNYQTFYFFWTGWLCIHEKTENSNMMTIVFFSASFIQQQKDSLMAATMTTEKYTNICISVCHKYTQYVINILSMSIFRPIGLTVVKSFVRWKMRFENI